MSLNLDITAAEHGVEIRKGIGRYYSESTIDAGDNIRDMVTTEGGLILEEDQPRPWIIDPRNAPEFL